MNVKLKGKLISTKVCQDQTHKMMRNLIRKYARIQEEICLFGISYKIEDDYKPLQIESNLIMEVKISKLKEFKTFKVNYNTICFD
jgi:hypothetical protein